MEDEKKDEQPEETLKEEKEEKYEYEAPKKEKKEPMSKEGKYQIITVALFVLLVISLFFNLTGSGTGAVVAVNSQEVAEQAVDYITENLIDSGTISLVSVEEFAGMYQVNTNYQDSDIPVFVTKDGVYMFTTTPIDMTEPIIQEQPQPAEVPKTDVPVANAFVMSYCPYGLQFLKAYIPVIELLGDRADLNVNFVHYLMHGEDEMTENTRMYCIQKEVRNKFAAYLRCFVETDDPETCMANADIDKSQIDSCMDAADAEFEITKTFQESDSKYPPYLVDAVLAQQYGVGGSPTFVVNGKTVSVKRSPEAIKQVICDAFNTPPEECQTTLNTTAEAPGIGPLKSGGTDTGAQC